MADMGTDAMEREKAFLFASSEGRLLYEVDQALRRLYRNEYGVCASCGKEIAKARLDAIPQVSLCVVCQEKQEKENHTGRG
jgi:RNA polymerase-binding transcription factor DksA